MKSAPVVYSNAAHPHGNRRNINLERAVPQTTKHLHALPLHWAVHISIDVVHPLGQNVNFTSQKCSFASALLSVMLFVPFETLL